MSSHKRIEPYLEMPVRKTRREPPRVDWPTSSKTTIPTPRVDEVVPPTAIPPTTASSPSKSEFEKGFMDGFKNILTVAGVGAVLLVSAIMWWGGIAVTAGLVAFGSALAAFTIFLRSIVLGFVSAVFFGVTVFYIVFAAPFFAAHWLVNDIGSIKDPTEYARSIRITPTSSAIIVTNTHPSRRAYVGRVSCDGRLQPAWRDDFWEQTTFTKRTHWFLAPGESKTITVDQSNRRVQFGACRAER